MAAGTYKKRRSAYEGEEARAQAIRRMADSQSVTQKMARMRHKTNRSAEPISHGHPEQQIAAAKKLQNKRIPGHRMTLGQALSRRTTDTSRARVLSKYKAPAGFGKRSFQPVENGGLNQVAKMRQKVASGKRKRLTPVHLSPKAGSGGRRRFF